jgi:hypothetical protein
VEDSKKKITISMNMSPAVPISYSHNPRASSGSLHNPRASSSSIHNPRASSSSMHNPRASSGSLAMDHRSPYGTPPSTSPTGPYEDTSMPINTPYSTPPSSASGSVARRRRPSISEPRSKSSHHHRERAASPQRPVVHQRAQSRPGSRERGADRDRHGSGSGRSTLVVPASSSSHRRSRSDTTNYSTHIGRYYEAYTKAVDQRGRTRFPRKLISREAVEQKKYPYTIENDGAITVLQALNQAEIDALVTLTEEIQREYTVHPPRSHPPPPAHEMLIEPAKTGRGQSRKAVSFYEKTLVHEVPPSAPSPPPSEADIDTPSLKPPPRSGTPATPELLNNRHLRNVVLVPGVGPSSRSSKYTHSATYLCDSPPKYEPLSPPGPSTPKPSQSKQLSFPIETPKLSNPPKTPEERLAKAEEKAIKAERIAEKKEQHARATGRASDEEEARKARNRAEELKQRVIEKERKEILKYEKREIKRKLERESRVRVVGRNKRGEMIMIKG